MGEFLAVLLMGSLFGVIHYRNFYWRSRWEKMTTGASMKFEVKGHGMLAIEGLTPAGLPALRLVAFHSPDFQVACHNGTGIMRVCLKDIDLRPSLAPETPANMDRAQLSRLGSSQG